MAISAFVSDLDGTMWSADLEIHDETTSFIEILDEVGIPLLIATGRRAKSAQHGLSAFGLDDRPAILMNGALARDNLRGESFLVEAVSTTDAKWVLKAFRGLGLEPIIYIDHPDTDMVIGRTPAASIEYLTRVDGIRLDADLDESVETDLVIGFGAFGHPLQMLDELADEIRTSGWASAIVAESIFEGDHGIMIQGSGIDKITGIHAWCARHGVSPDELAVIGDGANDIGMLESAAVSIVPRSAPASIRSRADHVIEPPEEGGWSALRSILDL